jgi:hypothetical protein
VCGGVCRVGVWEGCVGEVWERCVGVGEVWVGGNRWMMEEKGNRDRGKGESGSGMCMRYCQGYHE